MENNPNGGSKKIYITVIILLLLINGVAFYLLYSENKAKTDLGVQKASLDLKVQTLNDTLDSKRMQLEQFRGKNAELDSVINMKEAEIDKQQKEIAAVKAKGKMTASELAKAKEMISQDEASIADLQKKIDELGKQNKELTNQNQQLSTDLSTEKQTSAQLNEQNKGLSKKVQLGSLLQLKNLVVEGIEKKKNGKEVVEKRVKKVEKLRVTFETGENQVLEAGTLSLYVRIINPKGETISVADAGSGTIKNAAGETVQYTQKADIDWNQANKKVVVDWSQNIKDPGVYKVEVYQYGYAVGKGQVDLK